MKKTEETTNNGSENNEYNGNRQEIDSDFRLVIVAALRNKQLQNGARPRIESDPQRRRNTYIAIEETKQGLIHFKTTIEEK